MKNLLFARENIQYIRIQVLSTLLYPNLISSIAIYHLCVTQANYVSKSS